MSDIGHNSKDLEAKIQEFFVEYAECDEQSAVLNKKRADIREKVEELGLDRKAFHDQYMRAKRKLREKEGYDESAKIPPVSKKIRYLRENNGLSVNDLASVLEIKPETLEAIESGNADADENLLENIALNLQVPLSYLLDHRVQDSNSLNYLTRAMEKLTQNDHDELLQFADFLQSASKEK